MIISDAQRERAQQELGFPLPPFRLPYEDFRTDYGIGIVGFHWVVQILHLPAYQAARYRLAGAAEKRPDAVQKTLEKGLFSGRVTDDYNELLKWDEVQVVDSCFGHHPSRQHKKLELAEACAAAGKPLLLHKPVASTLRVAEAIARVSGESGVPICVNQNCRYNPAAYSVKELLREERLGAPTVIELQHYWRGDPRPRDDRRAGVMQHVIHHADLIRWWVGAPCISVYAHCQQSSTMAIYTFANGTVAYHMENHSGVERHENTFRVQTPNGIIKGHLNWDWHLGNSEGRDVVQVARDTHEPPYELPLPKLTYEPIWSELNKWIPHEGPYYDVGAPVAGMMGSMGSLMRSLSENATPDNHVSTGVESLRIALAAELSAQRKRAVAPEEVPSDFTTTTEPWGNVQ